MYQHLSPGTTHGYNSMEHWNMNQFLLLDSMIFACELAHGSCGQSRDWDCVSINFIPHIEAPIHWNESDWYLVGIFD